MANNHGDANSSCLNIFLALSKCQKSNRSTVETIFFSLTCHPLLVTDKRRRICVGRVCLCKSWKDILSENTNTGVNLFCYPNWHHYHHGDPYDVTIFSFDTGRDRPAGYLFLISRSCLANSQRVWRSQTLIREGGGMTTNTWSPPPLLCEAQVTRDRCNLSGRRVPKPQLCTNHKAGLH